MTHNSSTIEHAPEPAFSETSLMTTCGDDIDFALEIAKEYLESASESIELLQSAVESRDAHGIHEVAHCLKGSSRTVGGFALADACQALEISGQQADLSSLVSQHSEVLSSYSLLEAAMQDFCRRRAA